MLLDYIYIVQWSDSTKDLLVFLKLLPVKFSLKFNTSFCQLSVSRKEKQPCWHCLKCVFTFHWLVKWLILVVRNKCLPLNVWTTWPLLAFAQSGWGTVTMETVFAHKLSDWVWSVRCSLSVWKDIKHTHWDQRSVTWIVCVLKKFWELVMT